MPLVHKPLDFAPVSNNAIGHEADHQNDEQPESQGVSLAHPFRGDTEKGTAKKFLEQHHDKSAHWGPPDGTRPTDDRHKDCHNRDEVERKYNFRINESHVVHIEGAGKTGEKSAQHDGDAFVTEGTDAQGLSCVLVFANGYKIESPLCI